MAVVTANSASELPLKLLICFFIDLKFIIVHFLIFKLRIISIVAISMPIEYYNLINIFSPLKLIYCKICNIFYRQICYANIDNM
jgi:hypothetical protein